MEPSFSSRLSRIEQRFSMELQATLHFWANYSFDHEFGGFCTYLDQVGKRFANEKSVWAQGRGLYTFSAAALQGFVHPMTKEIIEKTRDFIRDYTIDQDGRMFFIVSREGKPIQKRRYAFSESFAAIGCLLSHQVYPSLEYLNLSRKLYLMFSSVIEKKVASSPKYNPEVVKFHDLASPMIYLITAQIFETYDPDFKSLYQKNQQTAIEQIQRHIDLSGRVMENISDVPSDVFLSKQRLMNPGHAIEMAWFCLDYARKNQNKQLKQIALKVYEMMMKCGWDKTYGGLYSFVDSKNMPLEPLEADMKLWWPQTEALICAMKAFQATKDSRYLDDFEQIEQYFFRHFQIDQQEFIGYLHRDNTPASTLKGNLFKGPFHIPRMFLEVLQTIQEMRTEHE